MATIAQTRELLGSACVERLPASRGGPARFALELRPDQDPSTVTDAVRAAFADLGATVAPLSVLDDGVLVLDLPDRVLEPAPNPAAFEAAAALTELFALRAAEPDLPTDFFPVEGPGAGEEGGGAIPRCWAGRQPDLSATWALDVLRVPEAWAFSYGLGRRSRGAGVVVAQPDTGITEHDELAGVVRVAGYDVLDDDPDPTDPLVAGLLDNPGHGTGTASVAVSPETLTVVGAAPLASHMPIRAVESVVRFRQVSVARAIDWAVDRGAHVITMSLGGVPSFALYRALRRAVDADVVVLAAAGNCVGLVVWPARYDDCVAVAGTDVADARWTGSSHGGAVDVSAPGQNVVRAVVPTGSEQGEGTSFAVALTAGVAALWLAHHGRPVLVGAARARGETLQAMFRRLVTATARVPAQWDPFEMGAGVVDARALLAAPLDLGIERESAPGAPLSPEADSVASLVAATLGPAAVDDDLDVHRHGGELAAVLLARAVATAGGVTPESAAEVPVNAAPVSAALAGAVTNPRLRDGLGLDGELPPEVGS